MATRGPQLRDAHRAARARCMTDTAPSSSPLVSDIEALVEGVPGWSPVDELFALALLVYGTAHLQGDIVEVGSWCGRSAVVLGAAARESHGRVHCVDLFPAREDWHQNADGTYSFSVELDGQRYEGYREQTVWAAPFESQLKPLYAEAGVFERFQANICARGLDRVVLPHRGTTTTFAASRPESFRTRLIFIDGDHGYPAVVNDIDRLTPFLLPGGWVCFDDARSGYDGVDRAIRDRILHDPAYDIKRQMTRKCFAARRVPGEHP
jgi:predicted O-methyltransferase YrrM